MAEMEKSDVDVTGLIGLGLVGTILFFVLVVAVKAFFFQYEAQFLAERMPTQGSPEYRQLRAEQLEQLSGYRWKSEAEGKVQIPIDRAYELVVEERGSERE